MGDMGSHYERAVDNYRAKAMEKFGHLSDAEVSALDDRLNASISELRGRRAEIDKELGPLEDDSSLLRQVWVWRLNNKTNR